jgi:hypothetical protein
VQWSLDGTWAAVYLDSGAVASGSPQKRHRPDLNVPSVWRMFVM